MDDGRITAKAPYGRHIRLTCVNHHTLEWSTKNIGSMREDGSLCLARTIFTVSEEECDCSAKDLRLHPCYDTMPNIAA